ncbi:MAG: radical SAM protein [Parvularculaceae bacterium]|nr:radical SAM protein [Parvularculaceae bacterium]
MADGDRLAGLRAHGKFIDPDRTREGKARAAAAFLRLDTLWVNTGTLCNIECRNCYIESSPTNDRLAYFTLGDFTPFLTEAAAHGAKEIGFTGGEPFMNPDIIAMIEATLRTGLKALVLTNAMRPAMRPAMRAGVRRLAAGYGTQLQLRVSLDHYSARLHDEERGAGAFDAAIEGLKNFSGDGVGLSVAGRAKFGEDEAAARAAYAMLFKKHALAIDASSPAELVLFPEMDEEVETPEITTDCWSILGKSPADLMCANSRMAIKRKGEKPSLVACTLIVDDAAFDMGRTIAEAMRPVPLKHPHCSRFCVLGGARCSQ